MIEYSHQNSLAFSYSSGVLAEKTEQELPSFKFARCTREPAPLAVELVRTAGVLYTRARSLGRPVYLLQSGGLDSEVMIRSFQGAGIPFQTISFRLPRGQNEHEMEFVRRFSDAHELNTIFYDFDFLEWIKTPEAQDWFKLSNCWEAAMLPHMKLLHHVWFELGGMPVLGGGDVVIVKRPDGWHYAKYEYILAWYWFCAKYNIDAGVAFFQHTPEVVLAMLREPEIVRAGTGQDRMANKILKDLRQVKYNVYHRLWPDLQRRLKFGGTELIHTRLSGVEATWRAKQPFKYDGMWTMPYDSMVASIIPSTVAVAGE